MALRLSNSTNPSLTSPKVHQNLKQNIIGLSRRDFINVNVGLSVMPLVISPPPPSIAREVEVGSFK
ncbi:hypothetical protein RND71_005929 [Anisodus tanguticus]|uniref:Uncharacterized protein n=1 Tax=Anisodus tanguticus TaxID=243964 RepID=A0AAE1SSF3_9SOLA|nr:hypothetical protein RND71_005929 [Anisodus tanguticus]